MFYHIKAFSPLVRSCVSIDSKHNDNDDPEQL